LNLIELKNISFISYLDGFTDVLQQQFYLLGSRISTTYLNEVLVVGRGSRRAHWSVHAAWRLQHNHSL